MSNKEIKNGWKMPYAHLHSHYEIYILFSGQPSFTIGGSTYRCVKRHAGLTVKQYINRLRIRNAMHDLGYSGKSLSFLQEICGFRSTSYVLRAFKQENSMTPTQYQNPHQAWAKS